MTNFDRPSPHLFCRTAKRHNADRGIALLLVIFMVVLASTIVVNLAYSTHLSSRRVRNVERQFQAEYLLKSAVNFARALLKEDKTPEDSAKDVTWGMFLNGMEVPPALLGVTEPNIRIELEIRPEDSKLPLTQLLPASAVDEKWRDLFLRLFQALGFDDDQEPDQSGQFNGKVFSSAEMVANLIDFIDLDKESYTSPTFAASGIEASLPEEYFPNRQLERLTELHGIPGFTPRRIRRLEPLVTVGVTGSRGRSRTSQINVNTAPAEILRVLHPDITGGMVDSILDFRSGGEGPFTPFNRVQKLQDIMGALYPEVQSLLRDSSSLFQVIGKVDYGTATYFIRAYVDKGSGGSGELPEIRSIELF